MIATMRRGRATSPEHVSGSTPLGPAVLPLTGAQGMGQQVTRALALNTCQVQHSWALNTWQVQHSWALGPAVLSLTGAQVMGQQVARPGGPASRRQQLLPREIAQFVWERRVGLALELPQLSM